MKKLLFIILFLGLTGCKLPKFGSGDILTEISPIVETDMGYVNETYFKNLTTGEIVKVIITDEEYAALGKANAIQPNMMGYKWLYSLGGKRIIATSTPELKDNQYYKIQEAGSSTPAIYRIKLPNEQEKEIDGNQLNIIK